MLNKYLWSKWIDGWIDKVSSDLPLIFSHTHPHTRARAHTHARTCAHGEGSSHQALHFLKNPSGSCPICTGVESRTIRSCTWVLFGSRRSDYRFRMWECTSREERGLGPGLGQAGFQVKYVRQNRFIEQSEIPLGPERAGNEGAHKPQWW